MPFNVRIVLMLTVLTPMKKGYSEGQMMEAVHVAAATWWCKFSSRVQMMNKVKKISL
jgi:hypothetical protein